MYGTKTGTTYKPFNTAILISFPFSNAAYAPQMLINVGSTGNPLAVRFGPNFWKQIASI